MSKPVSGALFGACGLVLGIGGHPDNPGLASVGTTEAVEELAEAEADVVTSISVPVTTTPSADPASDCPAGMVEVQGDFCPFVEQRCSRWLDPETKMRCAEFAPTGECQLRTIHEHFCIDRYEYPNSPGAKPSVMLTWSQAHEVCSAEGKRLCREQEWTLACEGSERLPYPYGYARDADACNIDRPHPNLDQRLLVDPRTRDAEVARLDQREPSGAHPSCVSPFGVYDMTGNVDEWVVNDSGRPYKSGLKGGYWGRVRDRCRPMTVAHDENFAFYQIGFRCCSAPGQTTHARANEGEIAFVYDHDDGQRALDPGHPPR